MDKTSKKILKHMNKADPDPASKIYFWGEDLDALASEIKETTEATRAAIRHLEETGHIKYLRNQHDRSLGFYLDHNGLHYKEHGRERFAEKLKENLWLPLLVSFLSGAVVDRALQALIAWIKALVE